jgi:hypothetical protein
MSPKISKVFQVLYKGALVKRTRWWLLGLSVVVAASIPTAATAMETIQTTTASIPMDWMVFAQQEQQPDLITNVSNAWRNFVESGQVWALLIGIFIGWFFRGIFRV